MYNGPSNMLKPPPYQQPVIIPISTSPLIKVGYATVNKFITKPARMTDYIITLTNGNRFRDYSTIFPMGQHVDTQQMINLQELFEFIACRYHHSIETRIIKKQTLIITGKQPANTNINLQDYNKRLYEIKKEEFKIPVSSIPHTIVKTLAKQKEPKTPLQLKEPLILALRTRDYK